MHFEAEIIPKSQYNLIGEFTFILKVLQIITICKKYNLRYNLMFKMHI
jgi:hypothetical protein